MKYFTAAILVSGVLAGCVAPNQDAPVSAQSVNPIVEQRIEQRVAEGLAASYPDLRTIRDEGAPLPTETERAAARGALLTGGQALVEAVEEDVDIRSAEPRLEDRAAALLEQLERDRRLIEAEGSLADRLPSDIGQD